MQQYNNRQGLYLRPLIGRPDLSRTINPMLPQRKIKSGVITALCSGRPKNANTSRARTSIDYFSFSCPYMLLSLNAQYTVTVTRDPSFKTLVACHIHRLPSLLSDSLPDVSAKAAKWNALRITHQKYYAFQPSLIIIRMFRIMQVAVVFIHRHAEMLHINEVID